MNQLEYQLDFLKKEFDALNSTIARFDTITQSTKNWAILIWTASVSFAMTREEGLREYVIFTAVIPGAFWYIDAWWRRTQRQVIFRINEISEFLNSDDLKRSFSEGAVVGIQLLDARSKKTQKVEERANFISMRRTVFFRTVFVFYIFQVAASVILGIVTLISDRI